MSEPSSKSVAPEKYFSAGYAFNFFNAVTWKIATGSASVLMAERLGGSSLLVGAVYSFVFLLTPIQILATFLLPIFGYKRVMLTAFGLRNLCIIPLVLLAFSAPESGDHQALGIFAFCLLLFCFFRAIGFSAYFPWTYSVFAKSQHNRYFSGAQLYIGLATLLVLIAGALMFRSMGAFAALGTLYTVSLVAGMFAVASLCFLGDAPRPSPRNLKAVWLTGKKYLLRPSRYRNFLGIQVSFVIFFTALYPFGIYYLKAVLNRSDSEIFTLEVIQAIGIMITSYLFKRPNMNLSPRPVFIVSLLILALLALLWSLVLQGVLGGFFTFALCSFLMGVIASLWFLALLNYMAHVIRENDRPLMLAFDSSVVSLISGSSAILWGLSLKSTDSTGAADMNIGLFQVYFVGLFIVSIALMPPLSRIKANSFDRKLPFRFGAEVLRPFRAIAFHASHVPDKRGDA